MNARVREMIAEALKSDGVEEILKLGEQSNAATDIFSGWTEVRPCWNRGQYSVCSAFGEIEGQLPFAVLGVDTDNGGEFLNYHLHAYFTARERPVEMTRSRPETRSFICWHHCRRCSRSRARTAGSSSSNETISEAKRSGM